MFITLKIVEIYKRKYFLVVFKASKHNLAVFYFCPRKYFTSFWEKIFKTLSSTN